MRHLYHAILASFLALFMSACYGSVNAKEGPTPAAVTHLTDSKSFIVRDSKYSFGKSSLYAQKTNKMMHGIRVVAEEGKKRGYDYFAIAEPSFMNNIAGSPISTANELFYLCGNEGSKEFLKHDTKKCDAMFDKPHGAYKAVFKAVYFKERPVDFLVWDIKQTLSNEHIKHADDSYEIEPEDS